MIRKIWLGSGGRDMKPQRPFDWFVAPIQGCPAGRGCVAGRGGLRHFRRQVAASRSTRCARRALGNSRTAAAGPPRGTHPARCVLSPLGRRRITRRLRLFRSFPPPRSGLAGRTGRRCGPERPDRHRGWLGHCCPPAGKPWRAARPLRITRRGGPRSHGHRLPRPPGGFGPGGGPQGDPLG